MKKVLHRGFKPSKCKTALQMANSRLKILKNKKEIQIKQLRRELAQLLEAGHTPTARIRVEHVVREEKTMAAYELIGIYCELLVVRLGVIESQKNCPIDLKEAVTSVLFASQRVSSDVPELSEIGKQFTTKYGKDFATSAIELRPDSGVSRLMVEKLSAKAPDGPTKVKILMEIATEHNVVWEAKSFVEPDPKDTELLRGASTFQSASSINTDSSRIPNTEQPSNVQAPAPAPAPGSVQHVSSERHHSPKNSYYASDERSSSRSNNVTSEKADDYHHSNARHSRKWFPWDVTSCCFLIESFNNFFFVLTGSRTDERERRNPNHSDEDSPSRSQHKWVDSADAARAAAEAAERASFAARAAAELSSKERMTRQNSTESHLSSASVNYRNKPSHRRNKSNVQRESFSEDDLSPRQNVRRQDEYRYDREKEPGSRPVVQPPERQYTENSRKNSSFGKTGREKHPREDETGSNVGYSEDVHLRKQSSRASSHSHSHSRNYSDENVVASDYMKSPSVVEENIFATEYDHQSQSSFKDIDSHDHGHDDDTAADTFDDYSSFFDKPKFDAEDVFDHGVGFSLLGSKSPTFAPTPATSWSFKRDTHGNHSSSSEVFQERPSSPLFDDVSTSPPASYHMPDPHAKFDNYGPDSGSDDDQPSHRGKVSESVDERVKLTSDKSQKFQVSAPVGHELLSSDTEEHKDDSKTREESDDSDADSETGLNFRPLTGGFRNKKTLPPYRMSSDRTKTSSKSGKEPNRTYDVGQTMSTSSSSRKDVYTKKASNIEKRPSSTPPHPSSNDDDDSETQLRGRRRTETKPQSSYRHAHVNHEDSEEEDLPTPSSYRSQERTPKQTTGTRDQVRRSFKTPASTSYEDEEEFERDVAQVNPRPTKTTGYSLRTKGQAKATVKPDQESHEKPPPKLTSERTPKPTTGTRDQVRRSFKTPASTSYEDEEEIERDVAQVNPRPTKTTGYSLRTKGQAKAKAPVRTTKPYQESHEKPSPKSTSEHKTATPTSVPQTIKSPDPETPSRASHVHPNLPDYDDIFARLGALRAPNRR
ncbi:unnamed protein product [Cochlearia groenlandica]